MPIPNSFSNNVSFRKMSKENLDEEQMRIRMGFPNEEEKIYNYVLFSDRKNCNNEMIFKDISK